MHPGEAPFWVLRAEKIPSLHVRNVALLLLYRWEGIVNIVAADMRYWEAPEKAHIIVSELLGSFGDNELSPECLDGAQRFLREDGVSIPTAYTSFIQPVTTSKLWNDVRVSRSTALSPPAGVQILILHSSTETGRHESKHTGMQAYHLSFDTFLEVSR